MSWSRAGSGEQVLKALKAPAVWRASKGHKDHRVCEVFRVLRATRVSKGPKA